MARLATGLAERTTASPPGGVQPGPWLSEAAWAQQQWGSAALGDKRRTKRAVSLGTAMAAQPSASLPQQMGSRKASDTAYHLLNAAEVSLEALSQPHWTHTRQTTAQRIVLQIQDTTELDYTRQLHIAGLGPIGDGRGRGLLLHSTLSVAPTAPEPTVIGLAHQQALLRQARPSDAPHPKWSASPEGRVWQTAVEALGEAPAGVLWVHVADRGGDDFGFLAACQLYQRVAFVLRVKVDRQLDLPAAPAPPDETGATEPLRLVSYVRSLKPEGATFTVDVTSHKKGQAPRTATVRLSWAEVRVLPPQEAPPEVRAAGPLRAWVVRSWEVDPPAGVEPLEWVLLTTVSVQSWAEAYERVVWYSLRWTIEDYHKCLKTGCRVEHTQLDHRLDIERLLGFLGPLAVRLLQLRYLVEQSPAAPAQVVVPPLAVALLAAHLGHAAATLTAKAFWYGVAQLGGHQGRRADGPPGWQTLWRGWQQLRLWLHGARLAHGLPPSQVELFGPS